MAEIIRMPRLSDTMEEGNIIGWLKKVGEKVEPGDILAEVETDKATMDLESFHDGVLLHIGVEEGPVPVNAVIAVIGAEGEDFSDQLAAEQGSASTSSPSSSTATEESSATTAAPASQELSSQIEEPVPVGNEDDGRVKASPLARSMAKENNLAIAQINGTGEGGRVIKRDVEKAIESGGSVTTSGVATTTSMASYAVGSTASDQSIPVSQMRKVIARRLGESKFSAPHFYLTVEINMDNAVRAREAIKAQGEYKVSYNDIVVKACAMALRRHPWINASWMDSQITLHGAINIGVAVAVEDGLLVPVIKHADQKPMHVINAEVREMAGRAKDKRLKPEEMQGNTFTISNLGMFDIEEFTAIINPPDACILAVGSIIEKPIVKSGQIIVGHVMKVTLSCDHRVVDGAKGAAFLRTLKRFLEDPMMMLV